MIMRIVLTLTALLFAAACGNGAAIYAVDADQAPPPVARPDDLDIRRVYAANDLNFYVSTPSPDGRLISEVDWITGDLAVIDLEAGRMRRITDKGPWSRSSDYAEHSVFSPDGSRIAYTWFSQDARGYEVRTARLDGSDTRVLFARRPDVQYIAVEDWSRDGTSILVTTFRADRTAQIGVLDARDGTYRALKTTDWRHPIVSAFSPDGRFIAYDFPKEQNPLDRDIYLMSASGGRETLLVGGPANDLLLGWLPDGSGILYRSRSETMHALLALRVVDGGAAGRPQLIRPGFLLTPFGFSNDAFFYGVAVERRRVHVATVDLAHGRLVDAPEPFGDDMTSRDAAWSPDGRSIAHVASGGMPELVIRSVSGELRRRVPLPLTDPRKTQWTPDGTGVLIVGTDDSGRFGVHRVHLEDGTVRPLLTPDPDEHPPALQFYAMAPDGRTVYYRGPAIGASMTIEAFDVSTGTSRRFLETPPGRALSVSPDGRWLAYTAEDLAAREYWLMIAPTSGGSPREVFRLSQIRTAGGNRGGVPWTPDGRALLTYVTQATPEGGQIGGIWQVPIDGSPARLITSESRTAADGPPDIPQELRISPDGRRLTFEAGRNRGEIWMMRGFAPAPAARVAR
jgi:Tol biopolymer transport system component